MGAGPARLVIDLQRWAKQTPGGRDPRDVLVELDAIQREAMRVAGGVDRPDRATGSAADAATDERRAALDVLVRRGVLTAPVADAAALRPVGEAAAITAPPRGRARPTAVPTRVVEDRPADPGAVVGVLLVALAPLSVVVAALVGIDRAVGDAVSTGLLLAGELVLAVTAGRGVPNAPRRIGRLSPVALRWVAALGALSPVLVLAVAFADPRAASEYVGWFFGVQCMMVIGLVAFSEIARGQDWNARGGRSADPRVERGEPVRPDLGAFAGIGLAALALLVAASGLAVQVDEAATAWPASGLLVAGALVLASTAGRADGLAPSRRGVLSARALRWVALFALLTPVVQLVVILTDPGELWATLRPALAVQGIAVVGLATLPPIARRQERGGPLRD